MLPISLLERPTNICRTGCTVEFSEDMTFALWTSQIWGRPHRNLRGGQRAPRCRRPRGRGGHPWWPFRRGDAERREASGARGSQPDSPRLRAARRSPASVSRRPRPDFAPPRRGRSAAEPPRRARATRRAAARGQAVRSSEGHGRGAGRPLPARRGWSRAAPRGSADISRGVAALHSSTAEDSSLGRRWWTPCRLAAARRTATFGRWEEGGAPGFGGLRSCRRRPDPRRFRRPPGRARAHLLTRSPVPPGGFSAACSCRKLTRARRRS